MLSTLGEVAKAIGNYARSSDIGTPFFADKRYAPAPFSPKNFMQVSAAAPGKKLAFVDAGNMEIFASPGLSVHYIRACFSIFRDNARIKPREMPQKYEFFSVSLSCPEGDDVQFRCRLIHSNNVPERIVSGMGVLSLSSGDPAISQPSGFPATVSVMGGIARRFSEWLIAAKIMEFELGAGDILLRDGTLQAAVKGEAGFAKKAFDAAEKSGVVLCACAKTSDLVTSTGLPLTSSVQMLAEKNGIPAPWFYHPVAKNSNPDHNGEIFVSNFHEKSRRAFRFEIEKNCAKSMSDGEKGALLGSLASNSRDGPFLGYPYGLIDADAKSRISFSECMNWRATLLSMLKRRGAGDFAEMISQAKDAHDFLNGMADKI